MTSYVTHLEGSLDGSRHPHDQLQGLHEGRPLLVRYDLEAIRTALAREDLRGREPGFWRYRELLPVERDENVVSLGETTTPLLECPRLAARIGLDFLTIKDESRLPGGSFKSRGMALAVSRAKELGATELVIPTAGNAGGALAAYAARAGLVCHVFMPRDTPVVNRLEAEVHGARVTLVDGLIDDCGALALAAANEHGWFDVSTLKEPYRIEGKKTMGLELAEQRDWRLPDAIFYPTGGGTGLIGMWKAFDELEALGWLNDKSRPKMFSCQSDGCAPIVRAFEAGEEHAPRFENASTTASGLRVPKAVGDFLILRAVRASGGAALAAKEADLLPWMRIACELEGISLCPETAACLATLEASVRDGTVRRDADVVVFNTGAATKYVESMEDSLRPEA